MEALAIVVALAVYVAGALTWWRWRRRTVALLRAVLEELRRR